MYIKLILYFYILISTTSTTNKCYVLVYVDEICIFTDDEVMRKKVIDMLRAKFKLRDFDSSGIYLGLELE